MPADQQITLSLVLEAQDKASAVLRQVGAEMAKLGDIAMQRFEAAVPSSAAASAAQEQTQLAKDAAAQRLQIARDTAAQELRLARDERTQMVRDTRDYYERIAQAQKTSSLDERQLLRAEREAQLDVVKQGYEERVSIAKRALAEETAAVRAAAAEQVEVVKAAGEKEKAVEKEQESLWSRMRERLETPIEFAKVFLGFEAGMAALSAFNEGIHEIPQEMLDAASAGQQYIAMMHNFYGSTEAAGRVLEWTNMQALRLPFSLDQIRQATASLSQAGISPGTALGPLANIATAYGTPLTQVIDTVNRTIATGSTRGLESYLRMTKAQLAAAGVEWDKHGHLISSSVLPALEAIGNSRFGDAAAQQAHTLSGALQVLGNLKEIAFEVAGEGLMTALKSRMGDLVTWIGQHQGVILGWANAVGQAMGRALGAVMDFTSWMVRNFGPPVIAVIEAVGAVWEKLEPLIAGAAHVIGAAIAGIGTVLQQDVLPVVQNAIGQMKEWWDAHAQNIATVWTNAQGAAKKFWDWLGPTVRNVMRELQGYWTIAWGVISGVVGIAIDLITGDWKKAKDDLLGIWKAIQVGVLDIVNGLVDQVIHVFALMKDPLVAVLNFAFSAAVQGVVDVTITMFTFMTLKVEQMMKDMSGNVVKGTVGLIADVAGMLEQLPGGSSIVGALLKGGTALLKKAGTGTEPSDAALLAQSLTTGAGAATTVGGAVGQAPLITTIPFDESKATATVDAYFARLKHQVDPTGTLGQTATHLGATWWNDFVSSVTKGMKGVSPLDLKSLGFPTLVGGAGAGGAGGGAADNTAAQTAYQQAKDAFDLFLRQGAPGGMAVGIKDIAAIARTGHGAGETDTQVQIELLGNTNQLIDKLLTQAHDHFELDVVNHASQKKLLSDENNYLAIMAKTPGITPVQIALTKHQLDVERTSGIPSAQELVAKKLAADEQTLADMKTLHYSVQQMMPVVRRIMADYAQEGIKPGSLHYRALQQQLLDQVTGGAGAGGVQVPQPVQQTSYWAPGYGHTTVAFGTPADRTASALMAMNRHLESMARYWQARARADEAEIAELKRQSGYLAHIEQNTQSAADKMDQPGRGVPQSAAVAVRNRGGFAPMKPY